MLRIIASYDVAMWSITYYCSKILIPFFEQMGTTAFSILFCWARSMIVAACVINTSYFNDHCKIINQR